MTMLKKMMIAMIFNWNRETDVCLVPLSGIVLHLLKMMMINEITMTMTLNRKRFQSFFDDFHEPRRVKEGFEGCKYAFQEVK